MMSLEVTELMQACWQPPGCAKGNVLASTLLVQCIHRPNNFHCQLLSTGGLQRPSTPEAPPLPDPAGRHAALVLLQRLLRGRAVQNEMYAGKMARLQLVRELRLGLEGTAGRLVEFAITKPCSKSCTVVRKHTCNKRIVQCWYTTFILV
eukprot:GHRR01032555.1.p1 GENE.GHRR01032555.1~~GHRR01032555.1.p1  ORF type:complete len:149 (-),score=34.42 GHRR01032555.1:159-605(-)